MAYWVLKILLTPVLRVIFQVRSEGTSNVPSHGTGDPGLQSPVLHRQRVPAPGGAPAGHLRGQGRVLREPEDGLVLPRRRDDPDQAGRRAGVGAGPGRRPRGARTRAACSASIRRAPVRRMAGCTRATPVWPDLPWSAARPVVPVAQIGTGRGAAHRVHVAEAVPAGGGQDGRPLRWRGAGRRDQHEYCGVHRSRSWRPSPRCPDRSGSTLTPARDEGRLAAPGSEAEPFPPERAPGRRWA